MTIFKQFILFFISSFITIFCFAVSYPVIFVYWTITYFKTLFLYFKGMLFNVINDIKWLTSTEF
jgi:hypothetical protein